MRPSKDQVSAMYSECTPRFKSAGDKSIRDLRVRSNRHVPPFQKLYIAYYKQA